VIKWSHNWIHHLSVSNVLLGGSPGPALVNAHADSTPSIALVWVGIPKGMLHSIGPARQRQSSQR
jgi:hypothetical protein